MIKSNSIFSDSSLTAEIDKYSRHRVFNKGEVLMKPGDEIIFIPIVLKGNIRIIRQDENGQ